MSEKKDAPTSRNARRANRADTRSKGINRVFGERIREADQVERANASNKLRNNRHNLTDAEIRHNATNPSGRLDKPRRTGG